MPGVRGIVGAQRTRGAVYNDFAFLDDRTGSRHPGRRTLARTNATGDVGRAGRYFASSRSQRHATGPQRAAGEGFSGAADRLLWLVLRLHTTAPASDQNAPGGERRPATTGYPPRPSWSRPAHE